MIMENQTKQIKQLLHYYLLCIILRITAYTRYAQHLTSAKEKETRIKTYSTLLLAIIVMVTLVSGNSYASDEEK